MPPFYVVGALINGARLLIPVEGGDRSCKTALWFSDHSSRSFQIRENQLAFLSGEITFCLSRNQSLKPERILCIHIRYPIFVNIFVFATYCIRESSDIHSVARSIGVLCIASKSIGSIFLFSGSPRLAVSRQHLPLSPSLRRRKNSRWRKESRL